LTVRSHDFRRSEGVDRSYVRALGAVFDAFARHATIELSTSLHKGCQLRYSSTSETEWRELAEELSGDRYFVTFTLAPMTGTGLLTMPVSTALRMLEFRLGGSARAAYPAHRLLTETDHGVLGPVLASVLDELARSFHRMRRTTATMTGQETNVQFVPLAAANEMCLVVRFDLALGGDSPSEATLCLPFALVRQMTDAMRLATLSEPVETKDLVARDQVLRAPLEIRLEIPGVELMPAALTTLAVGDVVRLYHPLERPLDVRAEGVLVARARQGRSGARVACSILEEVTQR
jgi:flagellar motor switch protein FliM